MTRHVQTTVAASRRVAAASRSVEPRYPCDVLEMESGAAMTRAVDVYLAKGYDIESAADGWVLLRSLRGRVALTTSKPPRTP